MALCKPAVSPLLMHWRYCSLAPSHRYGSGAHLSSSVMIHVVCCVVFDIVIFVAAPEQRDHSAIHDHYIKCGDFSWILVLLNLCSISPDHDRTPQQDADHVGGQGQSADQGRGPVIVSSVGGRSGRGLNWSPVVGWWPDNWWCRWEGGSRQ